VIENDYLTDYLIRVLNIWLPYGTIGSLSSRISPRFMPYFPSGRTGIKFNLAASKLAATKASL
jgi:hypothetical protein